MIAQHIDVDGEFRVMVSPTLSVELGVFADKYRDAKREYREFDLPTEYVEWIAHTTGEGAIRRFRYDRDLDDILYRRMKWGV